MPRTDRIAMPLPNLDDQSYADLVESARALIPTSDPEWTDHNASDPGIALVELFAWLAEMQMFRANAVPDRHIATFLRLLNGPDWTPGPVLADDVRTTITALRQRDRAITTEDYELLARAASPDVVRARCVPHRYLGAGTEAERRRHRSEHLSLVIVPDATEGTAPQPSAALRQTVWEHLDSRRALTDRHHVVGPFYVPVAAEILVARRADVSGPELRARVVEALQRLLHPLDGGHNGAGWPFERPVYVSEVHELLESLPGVNYVPDVALVALPDQGGESTADEMWHDSGDQVGIALQAHQLPESRVTLDGVVTSATFLPVQITATVSLAATVTAAEGRRAVKRELRRLLHPLHVGPDGSRARRVSRRDLADAMQDLPEATTVHRVDLRARPDRLVHDEHGLVAQVQVDAGELIDARIETVVE
jgi:hypothetical protein